MKESVSLAGVKDEQEEELVFSIYDICKITQDDK